MSWPDAIVTCVFIGCFAFSVCFLHASRAGAPPGRPGTNGVWWRYKRTSKPGAAKGEEG